MTDCLHPPRAVVVMGVSGCGKSTIGRLLATELEGRFIDGDDFHSAAAIAQMASGVPLTDADRADWLGRLGQQIQQHRPHHGPLVLACSALKRAYREQLRDSRADLAFVHLHGSRQLLEARLQARAREGGHFMPPQLLASQLDTLEIPENEPNTWIVEIEPDPETLSRRIAQLLK